MARGALILDAYLSACRTELRALKPGNVHDYAAGHGMTVADFEKSATASAPCLAQPGLHVGARILAAVRLTRAATGCNTNLGILLLAAPLAAAAFNAAPGGLRPALEDILAALDRGDAVALPGRRHRLAQIDLGRGADIVARAVAETAGIGQPDGGKGGVGVGDIKPAQHCAERRTQPARSGATGGRGQRRRQQQDAEIGVAAGRFPRPPHRFEDAGADGEIGCRQAGRAGHRARLEIRHAHAMAGGEVMDVARLQGAQLGPAGGEIGIADEGAARHRGERLRLRRARPAASGPAPPTPAPAHGRPAPGRC